MVYAERCLIVPAAYAPLARALCSGLAEGGAGDGMFLTPLSTSGSLPATHYISQGMIDEAFATLLPLTSFDAEGVASTAPGQPDVIVALGQGAVTLAQVQALLAAVDVSVQDPFTAMARLGLKMVPVEI